MLMNVNCFIYLQMRIKNQDVDGGLIDVCFGGLGWEDVYFSEWNVRI